MSRHHHVHAISHAGAAYFEQVAPVDAPSDGEETPTVSAVLATDKIQRDARASDIATALQAGGDDVRAIRAGDHQIRSVDGVSLEFPSQDITKIESKNPLHHGQTHTLTKHVGQTLQDNIDRLTREPHIRAAGGFNDVASAQLAVDKTIANPANQEMIADFLADRGRAKTSLRHVDVGATVGTVTTRNDLNAGRPRLLPATTANVVLIKDETFPEGYRVLTSYPDLRPPEVDAQGRPT